ncbi:MAG: hypothetical protein WCX65_05085 [bacterium]
MNAVIQGDGNITNDVDRREWFRSKVAELGELLRRLPDRRRDAFADALDRVDGEQQPEREISRYQGKGREEIVD